MPLEAAFWVIFASFFAPKKGEGILPSPFFGANPFINWFSAKKAKLEFSSFFIWSIQEMAQKWRRYAIFEPFPHFIWQNNGVEAQRFHTIVQRISHENSKNWRESANFCYFRGSDHKYAIEPSEADPSS